MSDDTNDGVLMNYNSTGTAGPSNKSLRTTDSSQVLNAHENDEVQIIFEEI